MQPQNLNVILNTFHQLWVWKEFPEFHAHVVYQWVNSNFKVAQKKKYSAGNSQDMFDCKSFQLTLLALILLFKSSSGFLVSC